MANLANIIPAIFTGPNGQRLTPEQIAERQQLAQSLMAQATDTSPNAGGVASILAKGVQGFAAGRSRNQADAAAGANAKASSANVASLLGLLGGGSAAPVGQGATVVNPMVAPVKSVAPGVEMTAPPQKIDISGDKETFIQSLLPAAIEEGARTGVDPRIIVAQAAQETGWGKSAPGNNYFGIKSHGQSGGQTLATNEVVDGKTVRINDSFRQFESPADSVKGYGEFILQNPRYKPLREAQGIDAQLQALQASGYATDPNYSRSVGAIARSIPLPQSGGYSDPMVSSPQAAPMQTAQSAPTGINPAIVEALSSPYASEQERSVAGLLLNQTMSQQQAAQAKALKQQERQQEIARRQQIAQQSGIDPAYAQDDELWKGATGQIFAAPSTSTVGGAVIDNRTRDVIYQAPAQNYRQITGQAAADLGLDPTKAYNVGPDNKIAPIGDSGVTVNNNMGGDKFGEEFAKLDAKALDTVATSGQAAQRNLGRINQLGELLKSSPTGFEGAVAQRAGEWGIPTKGLDTLQAAQAAINSLVPEQRQPGSGPMSDADLALFKQSLPRIINQPGGNDLIINTMKSIAQYDAEGANIVQQLRSGKLDRAKAFEALQNRVNPLDSFKAPGAPAENPMPNQQTATGWKDLGNGVKIRPKGNN